MPLPTPGGDAGTWDTILNDYLNNERDRVDLALRDGLTLDIRDFGGVDDNSTDNTPAFTNALAACAAGKVRTIELPAVDTGFYRVASSIQVDTAGITIQSTGQFRTGTAGGATIDYRGTGHLFQLDTDNGAAYDASDYSGTASHFTLRNLALIHGAPDTPLDGQPANSYKAGSFAIRDWRCGEICLDRVHLEGWDYTYWSVAGDINEFSNIRQQYCHSGIYLGPRSDQQTLHRIYSYRCDRVLHIDRAYKVRIRDCQFVDDGAASTAPIKIGSAWSNGAKAITFDDCWFEHYDGAASIPAWIDVSVGDSVASGEIIVNNPFILTSTAGSGLPHSPYFMRVGKAGPISITNPGGDWANLTKAFQITGTDHVDVNIYGVGINAHTYARTFDALSSGIVRFSGLLSDSGSPRVPSNTGRLYVDNNVTPALGFYISAGVAGWFGVTQNGVSVVDLQRKLHTKTAAPTTGTWVQGDIVFNRDPTAGGFIGWVCTTGGTPGTWKTWGVIS
jgi:hypothetical protein